VSEADPQLNLLVDPVVSLRLALASEVLGTVLRCHLEAVFPTEHAAVQWTHIHAAVAEVQRLDTVNIRVALAT